jgi:hypothetical protein
MRAFQHGLGEGAGRVEPVAVQAYVEFAASKRSTASQSTKSGSPGRPHARGARSIPKGGPMRHCSDADCALDPGAGGAVQPVRRIGEHRFEPLAEVISGLRRLPARRRRSLPLRRARRPARQVRFRGHSLRLHPPFRPRRGRTHARARRRAAPRPGRGFAMHQPLEPARRRGAARRHRAPADMAGGAFRVIAGDIGEARGEPAPAPARAAFRADHPAAQLDRLRPVSAAAKVESAASNIWCASSRIIRVRARRLRLSHARR